MRSGAPDASRLTRVRRKQTLPTPPLVPVHALTAGTLEGTATTHHNRRIR